jgi:NAD(P)-dependent dehydrogenase (short-subunit alcohol dehydrogenase family)
VSFDLVAVITGGASGLGEATARLVIERGGSVVLGDLQADKGGALAAELGARARFVPTDVSQEADVMALVDTAVSEFGRLDAMFNNAGIVGVDGPIDEIELDEYEFTMGVLLRSVFLGMKHAARVMRPARRGVILSTSSIAGVMGGLGPHVYAAAKSAIVGLTRNVAAELGPYGIRVNAIAPGSTATPMVADVRFGDPGAIADLQSALAADTLIAGRPGCSAADIANAALWLMSPDAGYVSGQTLLVDGGMSTGSRPPSAAPPPRVHRLVREAGRRGLDDQS